VTTLPALIIPINTRLAIIGVIPLLLPAIEFNSILSICKKIEFSGNVMKCVQIETHRIDISETNSLLNIKYFCKVKKNTKVYLNWNLVYF